jgi:hypothetical protein
VIGVAESSFLVNDATLKRILWARLVGSRRTSLENLAKLTFCAELTFCAGLSILVTAPSFANNATASRQELDRIAYAVDGAESSHGANPAMWRPNPGGPQGPMQVSDKAARDVGGGDRFDIAQNRAIGRAYLALLYRRYGNWPDAVAAYNWGLGNLDGWIQAGRPSHKLLPAVAFYSRRVLAESGLCASAHHGCTLASWHTVVPYVRAAYRSAPLPGAVIPGLEQSGLPLARFAMSGEPLPKLAYSGEPKGALEQSGRSLSRFVGRNRRSQADR